MAQAIARSAAFSGVVRGIVHEVRNPLQSILFASHTLAEQSEGPLVQSIAHGAERVSKAMELLSHLFDQRVSLEEPVVLQEVVSRVVELQAHNALRITGEIHQALPPGLPPVRGNPQDIEDALSILTNIGKETIGKDKPGDVTIRAGVRDEEWIDVTVSDTGGALPEPLRAGLAGESSGPGAAHEFLGAGFRAALGIMAGAGADLRVHMDSEHGAERSVMSLPRWQRGGS
jgi:nitrogen-specific signal transduction histidine kinase